MLSERARTVEVGELERRELELIAAQPDLTCEMAGDRECPEINPERKAQLCQALNHLTRVGGALALINDPT